jgi:L,D-peptidoglycan transpeptidase YkuD (ErfK/YbiS/YcfS/YnhG family)
MKRRKLSTAKRNPTLRLISLRTPNPASTQGRVQAGAVTIGCALGRGGIRNDKREGDGATPAGRHALRGIWYRGGRMTIAGAHLPARAIRKSDGWCDAPGDSNYNRAVQLPYRASHERMWREDHLYDVVIEIGWNDRPRRSGRGSAIFLHVVRPGYLPTEGCIAIARADFARLLPRLGPRTRLVVGRGGRRK